jgi:hypothetical protein
MAEKRLNNNGVDVCYVTIMLYDSDWVDEKLQKQVHCIFIMLLTHPVISWIFCVLLHLPQLSVV